jgi:hypothetical protein
MTPMRGSGLGGWLCVAIVAAVAGMAFYPAHPEPWLFWLVFLLTMPMSLAVVQVHLVIAALVDSGGWLTSTVVVLLWVGTAAGQMLAFRAMADRWREPRPRPSS